MPASLALSAARATLAELERIDAGRRRAHEATFRSLLEPMAAVDHVRGRGLLLGVELTRKRLPVARRAISLAPASTLGLSSTASPRRPCALRHHSSSPTSRSPKASRSSVLPSPRATPDASPARDRRPVECRGQPDPRPRHLHRRAASAGQGHGPVSARRRPAPGTRWRWPLCNLVVIPSTSRVKKSDSTPVRPSKT